MRSIRAKITILILLGVLVSSLCIGGVSILSTVIESRRSSAERLSLLCENRTMSINKYLNSIEQSVDMLSRYAVETMDSVALAEGGVVGYSGDMTALERDTWNTAQQAKLDRYLKEHINYLQTAFRSVANHTYSVVAYYYRINPEISRTQKGFFYTRTDSADFIAAPIAWVEDFDPDDTGHVGWFYDPLRRGRPTWLAPYFNENIGIEMISYVVPIFRSGTFVGVIGMDIEYETLVDQVDSLRVYDTGFACLVDGEGRVVYHPALTAGTRVVELNSDLEEAFLSVSGGSGISEAVHYDIDGVARVGTFSVLTNGMRLFVTAPEDEINAGWLRLVQVIGVATAAILVIFTAAALMAIRQITTPLRELTTASQRLAQGDYNVQLDYVGEDEVGILTNSFRQMTDHLKMYIKDLNSKAYADALTGVKNKTAFLIASTKLDDLISLPERRENPQFAVVMFDCNRLKEINDRYGHDKGDLFLQRACSAICLSYTHSPVFRLGGDEFVTLLQRDDFGDRERLLAEFDRRVRENNETAREPWERVDLARGMAVFDPAQDEDVDSVLRRADQIMYANKRAMKGEA